MINDTVASNITKLHLTIKSNVQSKNNLICLIVNVRFLKGLTMVENKNKISKKSVFREFREIGGYTNTIYLTLLTIIYKYNIVESMFDYVRSMLGKSSNGPEW